MSIRVSSRVQSTLIAQAFMRITSLP